MSCAVIIPARYASTRFPGKPLHVLAGKPLLQHVWERCRQCRNVERVLVATDDERIATAARRFGADVCMTSPDHHSGTDRIAEAARSMPDATHVINVQGDEPLISPHLVDELAAKMHSDPQIGMITAVHAIDDELLLENPNIVKCVLSRDGRALYFSRSRIPHPRGRHQGLQCWRHMGIYGFRRDFLEQFVLWEPSPLEVTESLEQLRALENGASIHVVVTEHDSPGIDTPQQAQEMEERIAALLAGSR
ncbi:MAG TPA: 3-deoxy-manno-octulosonate cytidylyltransferase [Verrucomicrobiales bacterium]|jgi:3-deoxy-manno-octulosonate cytidylyltransferase (CMP-KDO synthetase)|nr:3-deoxy-manno-octulosonate cytidylyltransferase [Verrucomicrobiales bacterium]